MVWLRAIAGLFLAGNVSFAGDWPQWLGPARDGSSSENVAIWRDSLKPIWRQPAGEGNSSPVIADGWVFLFDKIKDKNEEELVAFDAATGKPLWRKTYGRASFQSLYGNGPRATPACADGKVYTFGITGILTCFEAASGRQVWQIDTLKDLGAPNLFFGMSCSPIVVGKRVWLNVGGKGASIVAYEKDTGAVALKELDDRASYSSPILINDGKTNQLVFLTQQGLESLNPDDGRRYWKFPLVDKLLESSTTPVRAGNILFASSITYGSVGLALTSKNGIPDAKQVWKNEALTCYFSTPVAVEDNFYVVSGTKPPAFSPSANLHCVAAKTGQVLWTKPKVGKYHASLLRTGNGKLLMLEEAGNLVFVEPDPKSFRELARARVCGETWAHPALANGRLYVRDAKELICIGLAERP